MSRVRIVQLLCPQRHCIVATYYQSPDGTEIPEVTDRLREQFAALVKDGVNPWCGLCRSRDLRPEDRETGWSTIEEAEPHILQAAREQQETREYFRASRG